MKLEYDLTMPHHEYEEMQIYLESDRHNGEVKIDVKIPDGGGAAGNPSRVTLIISELEAILATAKKFEAALSVLKGEAA